MASEAGTSAEFFENSAGALLRHDPRAQAKPPRAAQTAVAPETVPPEIKKWPPAATLAFIVLTCGAFWTAVAFGVSRLI